LKIIITAGGTAEPIDEVRCITNRSTGRLGRAIAERLFEEGGEAVEWLYYVHGPSASLPETPRTTDFPVDTVGDLGDALSSLLREQEIGAIVHAMAVSDYAVAGTATLGSMVSALTHAIASGDLSPVDEEGFLSAKIDRILRSAPPLSAGKIPSELETPVLLLERTPKLIATLRGAAPGAIIVGFKLLCGATEDELVAAGQRLLESARCSLVFANDSRAAFGSGYAGFLIWPGGSRERLEGKDAIASRVARTLLDSAKELRS
jgi:phosphopantothenate-cysteine ligase